jgi:hypothetical protein
MKDISYNFGAIRDSIARLSSMELIKESKSDTLDSFIKRTNASPNLKKQQLIYKNIQECKPFGKERLAERFINQNLSMFSNSDWQEILRENMSVRKDYLGNPDISHVQAKKDGKLFEAINTLIESVTNKAFSNFEGEAESYDYVVQHLTREIVEEEASKEVDDAPALNQAWKYITKSAINNFNERYEHLNESEREVLSVLMSGNKNKNEYLEDIKTESVKIIDRLLESEVDRVNHDMLIGFKGKIEEMKNVPGNEVDDCILECIDLKQTLEDLLK